MSDTYLEIQTQSRSAIDTAQGAIRGAKAAERAVVESYRPLLVLDSALHGGEPPEAPQIRQANGFASVVWSVHLKNQGHGIATNISFRVDASITPDVGERVFYPSDTAARSPIGPVGPGEPLSFFDFKVFPDKDLNRSPEFGRPIEGWLNAQIVFYYSDQAGQRHGTSFCQSYRSGIAAPVVSCDDLDANKTW